MRKVAVICFVFAVSLAGLHAQIGNIAKMGSFGDVPVEITADGNTRFEEGVAIAEDNVQIHYGEYNLYCETWKRYMEVHSEDYSAPEDEDDLHRICMETVIQWRIEMQKLHAPRTAIGSEYHQSVKRMQTARENLAARRADRIATKGGGRGTNINIAVVAGNVDAAKAIQIKGERVKQLDAAEDDFLNQTGQSDAQQHEIIDVQVEPSENPPEASENSP